MKIKRIKIDHFGGLSNFSLSFEDGFNLVFGNNEDGKSTVLSFLRMMFYGDGTGKSDLNLNLRRRFAPFSGDKMGGEIEFTHEGRNFLLSKQFGKTQRSDKVVLLDTVSGLPVDVNGEVGEMLFSMSCAAFERSIFIGSLIPAEDGSAELSARLASLLYSGDEGESFATVNERLTEAEGDIHTARKKGSADRIAIKIDELENEKRRAEEIERRREENLSLLAQNDSALGALSDEKDALLKLREQSIQSEKKEELSSELERRNALRTLEAECKNIDSETLDIAQQKLDYAANLAAQADHQRYTAEIFETTSSGEISATLNGVLASLEIANRKIEKVEQDILLAEETAAPQKSGMFFVIAAIFAVAAAAGALVSILSLILLVPAAVLAISGLLKQGKNSSLKNQNELKLLDLKRSLAMLEDDKRRLTEESIVLSERKKLLDEAEKKAADHRESAKQKAEEALTAAIAAKAEVLAMLGFKEGDPSLLISKYRQDLGRISAARDWLKSSPYCGLTDDEIKEKLGSTEKTDLKSAEEYSKEISKIEQKINLAHAERARLLTENENLLRSCRTIGVIENDIAAEKAALSEQDAHYSALQLARNVLAEAYDEMRQNFAPELNRLTSELLCSLTGGKHQRATVSDDLAMTVSEEGEVPFSAEYLSSGSADQAELCLRLAIAKLTSGEQKLPLLLDDVLMQYDDTRAALATDFLSDYSKDTQVLLFTCHGFFKTLAEQSGANIVNMK